MRSKSRDCPISIYFNGNWKLHIRICNAYRQPFRHFLIHFLFVGRDQCRRHGTRSARVTLSVRSFVHIFVASVRMFYDHSISGIRSHFVMWPSGSTHYTKTTQTQNRMFQTYRAWRQWLLTCWTYNCAIERFSLLQISNSKISLLCDCVGKAEIFVVYGIDDEYEFWLLHRSLLFHTNTRTRTNEYLPHT